MCIWLDALYPNWQSVDSADGSLQGDLLSDINCVSIHWDSLELAKVCTAYLDFRIVGNSRLAILWWQGNLEHTVWRFLHRMRFSIPAVCEQPGWSVCAGILEKYCAH